MVPRTVPDQVTGMSEQVDVGEIPEDEEPEEPSVLVPTGFDVFDQPDWANAVRARPEAVAEWDERFWRRKP